QQRSLIIECFTGVRHEDRRDTQGFFEDENRRGRIPSRVATSLEGRTDPTIWKRRCIRLLLYQRRSLELLNARIHIEKRIMLLRGRACQRLKPVSEVSDTLGKCPSLDCSGYLFGSIRVDLGSFIDRLHYLLICRWGQRGLHLVDTEYIGTKVFRNF